MYGFIHTGFVAFALYLLPLQSWANADDGRGGDQKIGIRHSPYKPSIHQRAHVNHAAPVGGNPKSIPRHVHPPPLPNSAQHRHIPPTASYRHPHPGQNNNDNTLRCIPSEGPSYRISDSINVTVQRIEDFGFHPDCPCPYDLEGRCRQSPHMCLTSNASHFCTFYMKDITISNWGALYLSGRRMINFGHRTIAGGGEPQYNPGDAKSFLHGFERAAQRYVASGEHVERNLVVPLRYKWDDCFNHQSFQSIPLIGVMHDLLPQLWQEVDWHASRFTAALLLLLGVPREKILVERNARAKQLVLPWLQFWNPLHLAIPKGIARQVCFKITANLLAKQFSRENIDGVKPLVPMDYLYNPLKDLNASSEQRYVIYFNRSESGSRTVSNEREILRILQDNLRPEYHLIVLGPTREYKVIELLMVIWQQYARYVNRATVILGPHGKYQFLKF